MEPDPDPIPNRDGCKLLLALRLHPTSLIQRIDPRCPDPPHPFLAPSNLDQLPLSPQAQRASGGIHLTLAWLHTKAMFLVRSAASVMASISECIPCP